MSKIKLFSLMTCLMLSSNALQASSSLPGRPYTPMPTDIQMTDDQIIQTIKDKISNDDLVAGYLNDISIESDQGSVTLTGMVDTYAQRTNIVQKARSTLQVTGVQDFIQVRNN